MNERIRELAEQSGWMMGDEVEGFNTRLEKFAELIVRECMDCIAKVHKTEEFNEGYTLGVERCFYKIEEHFFDEEHFFGVL